jgi:hypothetical protein
MFRDSAGAVTRRGGSHADCAVHREATITPDREKSFNEWYNHEHIPDVFKFKGVVSARRYRATAPEDRFQYERSFGGGVSERQRASYVQVWP